MTASSSAHAGQVHSPACGAGLIDVHHHIVPPFYLDERRAQIAGARGGQISPQWLNWTPELALAEMDAHGVAKAVLSLSSPGVWFGDRTAARHTTRRCNCYAADLAQRHPGRFGLFAALPLTARLQAQAEAAPVPDNLPVLGNNAYRLSLGAFRQQPGRQMDLPPEVIGGSNHYRICPVGSDVEVLAGRLADVTGRPAASFSDEVLKQMIRLMRRDVRAGRQIVYDDPEPLSELLSRAILTVSAAAIDQRPTP